MRQNSSDGLVNALFTIGETALAGENSMLYFIVNRKSGTGKGQAIWKTVQQYLKEHAIAFKAVETKYIGHATELAQQVCKLPFAEITLVVIGGDGTINEVINGITDFEKIRFSIIPTGSGNDFARGLGIAKDPIMQLKRILASEKIERIDLGSLQIGKKEPKRYFTISAGVGLDAIVCKKALDSKLKKVLNQVHLGKLTYLILTVQTLFSMTTAEMKVKLDGVEYKLDKVIFVAAMNFRAEGGGVPMAPSADARDGKLSVCMVHGIPKWKTFFCLPFLVAAKHEHIKGFDIVEGKRCEMQIMQPFVAHADGEYCGEVTDITYECLPAKLRVIA